MKQNSNLVKTVLCIWTPLDFREKSWTMLISYQLRSLMNHTSFVIAVVWCLSFTLESVPENPTRLPLFSSHPSEQALCPRRCLAVLGSAEGWVSAASVLPCLASLLLFSPQVYPTLCDPMNCSTLGFSVQHCLPNIVPLLAYKYMIHAWRN